MFLAGLIGMLILGGIFPTDALYLPEQPLQFNHKIHGRRGMEVQIAILSGLMARLQACRLYSSVLSAMRSPSATVRPKAFIDEYVTPARK